MPTEHDPVNAARLKVGDKLVCTNLDKPCGKGYTSYSAGRLKIEDVCTVVSIEGQDAIITVRTPGGHNIRMYVECFSRYEDKILENFCDGKLDKNLFTSWLIRTLKKENSDAL